DFPVRGAGFLAPFDEVEDQVVGNGGGVPMAEEGREVEADARLRLVDGALPVDGVVLHHARQDVVYRFAVRLRRRRDAAHRVALLDAQVAGGGALGRLLGALAARLAVDGVLAPVDRALDDGAVGAFVLRSVDVAHQATLLRGTSWGNHRDGTG